MNSQKVVWFLIGLCFITNALDNISTYLCLTANIKDVTIYEANPLADALFKSVGLMEGLLLEMVITTLCFIFLAITNYFPQWVKLSFLGFANLLSAFAVVNNFMVMKELGLL